jgi:hypothetical protein
MKIYYIKTCHGFQTLIVLDGALVRVEDVRSLPRPLRLRLLEEIRKIQEAVGSPARSAA